MNYIELIDVCDSIKKKFNVKYQCQQYVPCSANFVMRDFVISVKKDNTNTIVCTSYVEDRLHQIDVDKTISEEIDTSGKSIQQILSDIYKTRSFNKSFREDKIKLIKENLYGLEKL